MDTMDRETGGQKRADYRFQRDRGVLKLAVAVDPEQPFDPEELSLWVGELFRELIPLTKAFALVSLPEVRLTGDENGKWTAAGATVPAATVGPVDSTPHPEIEVVRVGSPEWEAQKAQWVEQRGQPLPRKSWDTEQRERREAAVTAAEARGVFGKAKRKTLSAAEIGRQLDIIYQTLADHGGELRQQALRPLLPPELQAMPNNTLSDRLRALHDQGRVTRRQDWNAFQHPTYWRAVLPARNSPGENGGPEPARPGLREYSHAEEDLTAVSGAVAAARTWTRGKTLLILGGSPGMGHSKRLKEQELAATLHLKELRWPDMTERTPLPEMARELDRKGVDLLLLTRLNRKQSRDVAQAAKQRAIPVLWAMHGTGIVALVQELARFAAAQQESLAGAA